MKKKEEDKKVEDPKDKEFYMKVIGAGTKEGIIKDLKAFIADLEKTSLEELRDGIEHDTPNMKKPTRFAVLPDERRVLMGVDAGEIFEAGIVYSVTKVLGQIILTPIGEYALPKKGSHPCELSANEDIIYSGLHLIIKEESKNL